MSSALLLLALTIPGCGGSGAVAQHNPGTPAGTYSLTVTGTVTSGSATLTHSVTLKVTVLLKPLAGGLTEAVTVEVGDPPEEGKLKVGGLALTRKPVVETITVAAAVCTAVLAM